jgi:RNA polymerase sigma-B factor
VESTRLLIEAAEASPRRRKSILNRVVVLNLPLADRAAKRYRNRGVSDDDLVQVARLALVKASQRFDPERGCTFAGYAFPTILGELRRYFRDKAWMVRPPRRIQELQSELIRKAEDHARNNGHPATVAELAESTDRSPDEVSEAMRADGCFQPRSLDWTTDDGVRTSDVVGAEDNGFAMAENDVMLQSVFRKLTPRERRLVYLRFYQDRTQAEIAREFGVTQMQISRLLKRLFARMRDELVAA